MIMRTNTFVASPSGATLLNNQKQHQLDFPAWERRIVYLSLTLTILVLSFNAHDSGLLKEPLFVICALLLISTFAAGCIVRNRLVWPRDLLPAVLFFGFSALSALYSGFPYRANQALLFLLASATAFFAGSLFTRKQVFQQLLLVLAVLTLIVCGIAIVQFSFAERLPVEFYLGDLRRIGSTLGNPSFLAAFLAAMIPLLLVKTIAEWGSRKGILYGLTACTSLVVLFLTQSRSGIMAGTIGVLLFLAIHRTLSRRQIVLLAAVLLGIPITILFLSPDLAHRFGGMFDTGSTFGRRVPIWHAGIRAIADAPFFGHGLGSFEQVMVSYRPPDYWIHGSEDVVPHAHNEFLEIGAETGTVGILLFIWLLVITGTRLLRLIRNGTEWDRLMAAGLIAFISVILVDNLTNVSLRQAPVTLLSWLMLGIAFSLRPPERDEQIIVQFQARKYFALIPFSAFLFFSVWYTQRIADRVISDRHTMKGLLEVGRGQNTLAIGDYRLAISANPNNVLARSILGLELLKRNQAEEALQTIDTLQYMFPTFPKSNLIKAVALLTLKQYDRASEAIDRELKLRDHPEAYYMKSFIRQASGDFDGQRAALVMLAETCIKGRITTHLEFACGVLVAKHPPEERTKLRELLERLRATFPDEGYLKKHLQELTART